MAGGVLLYSVLYSVFRVPWNAEYTQRTDLCIARITVIRA